MIKSQNLRENNFTTSDYNKFTSDILDEKIKKNELVNKRDISNQKTCNISNESRIEITTR